MTRRASLTAKEKAALMERQGYKCAACGERIHTELIVADCRVVKCAIRGEFDHATAHALRPGQKPNQALCVPCHAKKTKADVRIIAKCKRLTGETGKSRRKRPIPSRGFDRRFKRRMDGTVEWRT